jgi:hypothetical protein
MISSSAPPGLRQHRSRREGQRRGGVEGRHDDADQRAVGDRIGGRCADAPEAFADAGAEHQRRDAKLRDVAVDVGEPGPVVVDHEVGAQQLERGALGVGQRRVGRVDDGTRVAGVAQPVCDVPQAVRGWPGAARLGCRRPARAGRGRACRCGPAGGCALGGLLLHRERHRHRLRHVERALGEREGQPRQAVLSRVPVVPGLLVAVALGAQLAAVGDRRGGPARQAAGAVERQHHRRDELAHARAGEALDARQQLAVGAEAHRVPGADMAIEEGALEHRRDVAAAQRAVVRQRADRREAREAAFGGQAQHACDADLGRPVVEQRPQLPLEPVRQREVVGVVGRQEAAGRDGQRVVLGHVRPGGAAPAAAA